MRLIAVLAFTVLLSGCLASEETEIRVLREQGEPAIVTWELQNIYSDERDAAKIREDFNDLVEAWRGDKTLAEQARDDGILVKHRELSIRDNKIFGRETGIVENLTSLHIDASADGTVIRMKWDDSDSEIAETNGRLVKRDGETFVEWPKNATELRWKTHDRMKNAFGVSQPVMLQLLREYQATHQ
jgi:hypothetical protein